MINSEIVNNSKSVLNRLKKTLNKDFNYFLFVARNRMNKTS
ncbi:hypothetical protein PHEL85_2780 [Polaribacter sp. Hel1_85]|nr:hypothetical protein PHEL85_2780 [Polaribacter sp. Hel1_85]